MDLVRYFMKISILKKLTWEDNWQNYIKYGSSEKPTSYNYKKTNIFADDMPNPEIMGILNLMHEFSKGKYGYTVYEAFLKATEIKASSYTLNCDETILQRLIKLKKQDIKNIKKGVFDEELKDYIKALENGYKEWLNHPYSPYYKSNDK